MTDDPAPVPLLAEGTDEQEQLLLNVLALFVCSGCGASPLDKTWQWCNWDSGYRGEHIWSGEPCGPVVLRRDFEDELR